MLPPSAQAQFHVSALPYPGSSLLAPRYLIDGGIA
jgi:hypothetical protein